MWVRQGRLSMQLERACHVGPGQLLLLPAGQGHRMLEAEGVQGWALALAVVPWLSRLGEEALSPFAQVQAGASAVWGLPEGRGAFVGQLFEELAREGALARPEVEVQRSLLSLLLAELRRGRALGLPSEAGALVGEALRLVAARCLGPLRPQEVAGALGVSATHLTTLVRQATGRPLQAWIVAGRLAEARLLLATTSLSVEAIAHRVGYAEAAHFARLFQREAGLSPGAFRRQHSGCA